MPNCNSALVSWKIVPRVAGSIAWFFPRGKFGAAALLETVTATKYHERGIYVSATSGNLSTIFLGQKYRPSFPSNEQRCSARASSPSCRAILLVSPTTLYPYSFALFRPIFPSLLEKRFIPATLPLLVQQSERSRSRGSVAGIIRPVSNRLISLEKQKARFKEWPCGGGSRSWKKGRPLVDSSRKNRRKFTVVSRLPVKLAFPLFSSRSSPACFSAPARNWGTLKSMHRILALYRIF